MKISRISLKVFLIAAAFYSVSLVCYLYARQIYNEELERKLPARLFWGMGVVASPDLNNWHYIALASFCVAIAFTIAGIWLRKSDD